MFPRVSIDSRSLKPGEIFWALKGPNFDAHNFVDDALGKGASGAVVDQSWRGARVWDDSDSILLEVEDTGAALIKLATWWRERFDIPVVAITGSIGKTTTKDWAATLLGAKYEVFKTPGNRNNLIGLPLALLDLDRFHQIAVVEMGANHIGEIADLCDIADPTVGMITKIAPAHLEGFGSRDGVVKAKKELYDYIGDRGTLLVPVHDQELLELAEGKPIAGFGLGDLPEGVDVEQYFGATVVGHSDIGQPILDIEGQRAALQIVGDLWLPSVIAAVAVARYYDVSLEDIVSGLSKLEPSPGRLRRYDISGIEVWDDTYNSNPESLKAAIELVRSRKANRNIMVLGDMCELGDAEEELHGEIGDFLVEHPVDALFTYGNRAVWIGEPASKSDMLVELYHDEKALAQRLGEYLKPGDAVLFKASRSMFLERVLYTLFPTIAEPEHK
jgi:UDP-N-acetylmuramoyl-tripeptide--D-alanyl-D-alanine ligase